MDCFSALAKELSILCPSLALRAGEPMKNHTTFRIGGPARLMALPKSAEECACAVRAAARLGVVPFFMGNGSNLLVADEGAGHFVIKCVDGLGELSLERGDGPVLSAGSGVLLSRLANFAQKNGLSGLEFAHGIPGSLGGAVTMNAGAYGGEMSGAVVKTECLTPEGERVTVAGGEHGFSYRHSAFSDGRRLILRSELRLQADDPAAVAARMAELSAQRRSRQPLDLPSAGSAFKRPPGHFAAALIDGCGLKGVSVGGAQVSEKHAGFIVNRGGATCRDVLALFDLVRERVFAGTGVTLEPEVKTLGI